MATHTHSRHRISTGLFEVDLVTGEVLHKGRRVPLQEQPFRVLAMLLERPGEVVTREDLQSRLWPADTYVSFDEGLNTAIRKLRVLFGDSADNPRFIETIPRRGYRFIAPVRELAGSRERLPELKSASHLHLDSSALASPAATPTPNGASYAKNGPQLVKPAEAEQAQPAESSFLGRKLRWKLALPLTIALLALISWVLWSLRPRTLTVTNIEQITNDRKAKIPFVPPRTDGLRLYFVEGMPFNSGSGIAQVSATGGETTFIDTSLREVLVVMDISPDRSKLLVHNGAAGGPGLAGPLWIQPLPAGSPYRVGNLTPSSAGFTPDGAHILYGDGRLLKIANLDGSDPHPLANLPGIIRGPRFSPDGKVIRFWQIQPQGNARSIWEMNADGTNLHLLLPNWKEWPDQCCGIWSPDGDYYYLQARNAKEQAVWVLPERRSIFGGKREPYRLISGPLHFGGPSPSPDGKRLFVVGEEARVELFRYDSEAKRFDPFLGGLSAGPIDISPDGKWVAYVSYPDQTLWRSRVDLSEKMRLTFPPVRAFLPRWSPDGTRIAFQDVQINKPWTISVISALGGDSPKPILPVNGADTEGDPTWTPDGKSVVFFKADAAGAGVSAVYRLNLESKELIRIPGSEGITSPRLSPDGRFIAGLKVGGKALVLLDQNTNHWSTLAEGEAFGFNEWSHDSKYVYARANQGGSADIVRVRIEDHVMEPVLSLKDFPTLVDPVANWIGLTSDGGILLMRDRSVQEIYALDLARK